MESLSEALRQAMDDCGESLYRIAKDADIPYPVLFRFHRGTRELTLPTASKLVDYLGLELRPRRKAKRRRAN